MVYIPPSWKLARNKQKEFKERYGKYLHVTVHDRLLRNHGNLDIFSQFDIGVLDETSMFTQKQWDYINKHWKGQLVVLGDNGYQLPPINEEPEMTLEGFDNVVTMKKNYRFKCDNLKMIAKDLRDCIKHQKEFNFNKYKHLTNNISFHDVKDLYKKEDLILVSQHWVNDEYNKVFKDIEKYKVTKNSTKHKNGEIVYEKVKGVDMELRHGYTVHSIQGETHRGRLFIDMNDINSLRMLYTAISRATRLQDIYFVKPMQDKVLKKKLKDAWRKRNPKKKTRQKRKNDDL